MITSLEIQNFQSHEKTSFNFHPGVNIIVGETDKGKTAIIRALRWIVWNRPSGDSIRSFWGGVTSVKLFCEEGSVTRIKDKSDSYILTSNGIWNGDKRSKTIFKAFGTSVPEEISRFLNINEINLQEQLDNHFLLGKGWTPGSIAAHFNKVANISKIDSSTSNVNKRISKLESDIKYDKEQIVKKQSELLLYEYLDSAESLLEILEDQENRLIKYRNSSHKLKVKIEDIEEAHRFIDTLNEEINIEDSVNILLNQIERKEKLTIKKNKLKNLIDNTKEKQEEIDELSRITHLSPLITGILKDITEKESKINEQKTLFKTISSISNIKTQLNRKKESYTHLIEKFNREFPDKCPLCGLPVPHDH